MPNEKSSSCVSSKRFFCASVSALYASCFVSAGVRSVRVDPLQVPVHSNLRRRARRKVKVRPLKFDHLL